MKDNFNIDSHKLMYHVERVASWLKGDLVYPIYMEISPAGACNHRCVFCSMDFMGYKNRFIDETVLKDRITEFGQLGVKSIMYAGEGEPFLHRHLPQLIAHTHENKIDVAITSNGVLMTPVISDQILEHVEWIKISCNAGTPESYARIHGTREDDFKKVLLNIEYAVNRREQQNLKTTIGLQILLIPENSGEIEHLAQNAKDIGADYLVVKPYNHHSKNAHKYNIKYKDYEPIATALETFNSDDFQVVFRANAMRKWDSKQRDYSKCNALPFWAYIDAAGNVWGCLAHLLEEEFLYGSIMTHSFQQIWESEKKKKMLDHLGTCLDIKSCKMNCRMDEVNRYLNNLIHPPDHVNFI